MWRTDSKSSLNRELRRVGAGGLASKAVAFWLVLVCAGAACVRLPQAARVGDAPNGNEREVVTSTARLDINTATPAELERLPGIGPALAARIVAHRTRYGPFRRAEHLVIVPGISERRFANLRPFITAN